MAPARNCSICSRPGAPRTRRRCAAAGCFRACCSREASMLKRPTSPAELPPNLPIFPLTGALLLPLAHRPLNVFEPRYVEMVDAALRTDRLIGLIQPQDTSEESPRGRAPLQSIGCEGRLTNIEE